MNSPECTLTSQTLIQIKKETIKQWLRGTLRQILNYSIFHTDTNFAILTLRRQRHKILQEKIPQKKKRPGLIDILYERQSLDGDIF